MKTIDREELKAKIDRACGFVLLEVLTEESYRRGHLPGAVLFHDTGAVPEIMPSKSAEIVDYCSSPTRHASTRVVREQAAMGYENAADYEGGRSDRKNAVLPMETGGP